jgi:DNA-directed RNA polymerase specialized sigma24 family protein
MTDASRTLDFRERRCLELIDQGRPVEEIGRVFNAHPLVIERTIARARQKLADVVDDEDLDDE